MFQVKKKYHNLATEQEISAKGFSVYNYISLDELLLTVRKDFLDVLSKINIPFGIISIIIGIISFLGGNILALPLFLLVVYTIIFIYLFFKLIFKTYYFLLLRGVVYTKNGIILGEKIYSYNDTKNLDIKLLQYEKIFLEYLGSKSRMREYIDSKRKDLVSLSGKTKYLKKAGNLLEGIGNSRDNSEALSRIIIPAILSFAMYVVFMYVFYYIGYFIGILFVKIYSIFIKILLLFKNSIELQIKNKAEKIDINIKKMMTVYSLLDLKFSEFSEGEISDISGFTKNNFDNFYTEIFTVFQEKSKLEDIINKSIYTNFIDFQLFEKYLKNTFNKPVASMLSLLQKQKKLAEKQLDILEGTKSGIDEYSSQISFKKRIIENNINLLTVNISKLQKTKI